GRPILVALEPLWMSFQRILVGKIAIHAGDSTDSATLHRGHHLTKQIAGPEGLAAMVIRTLGWIESDKAVAVQEHGVVLQGCSVVAPGFGVHGQRIALVVVDLSTAAHHSIPGA